MGLFRDENAIERIEIDDAWIDLRRTIAYGDRKYAQAKATEGGYTYKQPKRRRIKAEDQQLETTANFNVGAYNIALLERLITAWSEEVSVSAEAIEGLPERTVDLLMAKVDQWNPTLTEEETRPLESDSPITSAPPGDTGLSPMKPDGQNDFATLPITAKS